MVPGGSPPRMKRESGENPGKNMVDRILLEKGGENT